MKAQAQDRKRVAYSLNIVTRMSNNDRISAGKQDYHEELPSLI